MSNQRTRSFANIEYLHYSLCGKQENSIHNYGGEIISVNSPREKIN